MKNRLKEIWARGDAVVNGWCSIPSSFSAEVMAHQGFDSLTVDMQHGVCDYTSLIPMLQAISTMDAVPMARIPWSDPASIMKTLDAGVMGLICPMINSKQEAEDLVAAAKYPPRGFRSFGPIRAKYAFGSSTHGGGNYHEDANEETFVMPQIETRASLENIDDILSVDGIDAIYCGPSDLNLAMGFQPRDPGGAAAIIEARKTIIDACKKHNVAAGIHTPSSQVALERVEEGFQFVTIASDDRFLMTQAKSEVEAMRKGLKQS